MFSKEGSKAISSNMIFYNSQLDPNCFIHQNFSKCEFTGVSETFFPLRNISKRFWDVEIMKSHEKSLVKNISHLESREIFKSKITQPIEVKKYWELMRFNSTIITRRL